MLSFADQLGREINLSSFPKKIISVVPSQTELLFDLALDDEVVGITKFCVHPDQWFYTKRRVGGTKSLNLDIIDSLNPDLIIANKEENTREQIEILINKYPVWISDVHDLETSSDMILRIGKITNRDRQAREVEAQLREVVRFVSQAGIPPLELKDETDMCIRGA